MAKETGMVYTEDHKKFKYYYEPKGTSGDVEVWPLSDLSKYESLIYTKHSEERAEERHFSKQQIQEFFEDTRRLKVLWRPSYNTHTGLDARIIGEMKGVGLITVITAGALTESDELLIYTAHQINHSRSDLDIYYEGLELLSEIVEEQEGFDKIDA